MMSILPLLLILFYIYIEAVLFVKMTAILGIFGTLLFIIISCCIGLIIAKAQGIKNMTEIRKQLSLGDDPTHEMNKAFVLLIAGVCFILPGFLSTIAGTILLFPLVQNSVIRYIAKKSTTVVQSSNFEHYNNNSNKTENNTVIEGQFVRKDNEE